MSVEVEVAPTPRTDFVRGALRDGLWNAAALAGPGVANVVIVAILIRSLGPAGFAPWAAAVAVVSVLTVLDSGLSATTARSVARSAAGDRGAGELVDAAAAAYAGLAVVVVVAGSAAALLIPGFIGAHGQAALQAIAVGVILALDLAVVIATGGWFGALRGARRFDVLFAANAAQVAVSLPLTLVLVPGNGLVGAAIAQFLGRLVARAVAGVRLSRAVPWVRLLPRRVSLDSWRRVGVFTLPILAISVSTQMGIGIDPIIVAVSSGPVAVGLFAAGGGLVRYLAFMLFPVLGVLLPSFAELAYAVPGASRTALLRCVRLGALLGALTFGTLAANAAPALEAWIGRSDLLSVQVLVLYAIAHAFWTPSQVLILMLIAAGRHGIVGAALLIDAVANAGLSIALAFSIGPLGVALSTFLLLVAAHAIVIPVLAIRRLGVSATQLVRALGGGFGVGAAVVGLASLVPVQGTAGLVVRSGVALAAGVAALGIDQWMHGRRRSA